MLPIRRRVGRHRGLIGAVVLSVVGWVGSAWLWPTGPSVSRDIEGLELFQGTGAGQLSADGRFVLAGRGDGQSLLDVATGRMVHYPGKLWTSWDFTLPRSPDVAWMESGRYLVARVDPTEADPGRLPDLRVWDARTGSIRETFRELGDRSVKLRVPNYIDTSDGSQWPLFTTSDDGSTLAYVHHPESDPTIVTVWKPDGTLHHFSGTTPLALSPDGRYLALTDPSRRHFAVWEVATERLVAETLATSEAVPGFISLSAGGRRLAECRSTVVSLWDVATSIRVDEVQSRNQGQPWFSPDGSLLYLLPIHWESGGQEAEIWDVTRRPARKLFTGKISGRSDDGRRIVQIGLNLERDEVPEPRPFDSPMSDADWEWNDLTYHGSKLVELPPMTARPEFLDLIRGFRMSRDGRWVVSVDNMPQPAWQTLLGRLPWWFRASLMTPRKTRRIVVREVATGRGVGVVEKTYEAFEGPHCGLSSDGKSLVVCSIVGKRPGLKAPKYAMKVEVWDLPMRSPTWPILFFSIGAAVLAGIWSDWRTSRSNLAVA